MSLFIEDPLPMPLEEKELLSKFKEMYVGNPSAREEIIHHNIRLVLSRVQAKYSLRKDKEELVSIGILGLMKAVDTFDIRKNTKFSSYATIWIDGILFHHVKKLKKYNCEQSMESVLALDLDGNPFYVEDKLMDETNITENYEKKELIQNVRDIIEELPEREKQVLILYFGLDNRVERKQEEIASLMCLSQSCVSKTIKKSLKYLMIRLRELGLVESHSSFQKSRK